MINPIVNKVDILAIGRARNYDTAIALNLLGQLGTLFAGGYIKQSVLPRIVSLSRIVRMDILYRGINRSCGDIDDENCISLWKHLIPMKLSSNEWDVYINQRQRFSKAAGKLSNAPILMAEQTEACEAFEYAATRGTKKILIMTGQSPVSRESWLNNEHLNWPPALPMFDIKSMRNIIQREKEEILHADLILSPSKFVTESLISQPEAFGKRIFQINWPIEFPNKPKGIIASPKNPKAPYKILFVGSNAIGKGLMYLIEALERFPKTEYETKIIGNLNLPNEILKRIKNVAKIIGHVPYSLMAEYYSWADIFVLPTLSEGRARVVLEAMAAGVPVITTINSGSPITNEYDGIICEPRNSISISYGINKLLSDVLFYKKIQANAINTVHCMTLPNYARELSTAINKMYFDP